MLSSLITAFRQQYPRGSLVSDLLTIHDGQYVVRAMVGLDGVTLSSGLGANASLEVAEDAAATRALERLGLAGTGAKPPVVSPAPAAPVATPGEVNPPLPLPPVTPLPLPKLALAKGAGVPEPSSPIPEPSSSLGLELSPETAVKPPLEPLAASSTKPRPLAVVAPAPTELSPEDPEETDLGMEEEDAIAIPEASSQVTSTAPVDLSDIIAQTDVELQRLGWGVSQGREFLEQTYGKRSRHDLTDEELLEFLLYLEAQASPLFP